MYVGGRLFLNTPGKVIYILYTHILPVYFSDKFFSPPIFYNASFFAEWNDLDSPCPVFAVRNKLLLKNTAAFPALDTPAAQNNISRNEHSVTAAYTAKKASPCFC